MGQQAADSGMGGVGVARAQHLERVKHLGRVLAGQLP